LVQAGVDDLESGVTKGSRDHLGATIVTIQAGLGDYDAIRTFHV
jgi:hypothetical protein